MPVPRRAYRAVLFDFFGTLTSAVVRGPAHDQVARRLGCDPAAFTALLDSSFRTRARGGFGSAQAALRWACHQLGTDPPEAALRAAARDRVAAVRADTRLRPDALAAVAAAQARGLRTAVVSDCSYELPVFWPDLPLARLVPTRVFSVEVGECKPHPLLYETACHRLGVAPAECLYIGDGGSRELSGAVAVGMAAVRLAAPDLGRHLVFAPDRDFSGPAVNSLLAAVALVDRPVSGCGNLAAVTRTSPPAHRRTLDLAR